MSPSRVLVSAVSDLSASIPSQRLLLKKEVYKQNAGDCLTCEFYGVLSNHVEKRVTQLFLQCQEKFSFLKKIRDFYISLPLSRQHRAKGYVAYDSRI